MGETIRILHVFGKLNRGGAETFIMNVYRNIDRSKIQFDFMAHTADKCAYDDEIEELGGKIYRVPAYKVTNDLKYKSEWQKFFKNNKEHKIIHGHMTSTAAIYLKIAKKNGLTAVSHIHSTSSGKGLAAAVKDIMQKPLKNIANCLFACSEAAGVYCYGTKVDFHVIKNAIDTKKFVYDTKMRKKIRTELRIEGKFVIGHIGRFTEAKNHSFILEIFKKIYENNNNAVLLLVGDGELRGDIEKKVDEMGLKDDVIFTGIRSDIPELLCAMDVFLFPSLWEGLPVTLVEAQASGVRCVVSDVITKETALTDLIEYISLEKSAAHWADKILVYNNGYERRNMQEEIKLAGFDIKELSSWLENFYLGAENNG